jgi:hypothetical protein
VYFLYSTVFTKWLSYRVVFYWFGIMIDIYENLDELPFIAVLVQFSLYEGHTSFFSFCYFDLIDFRSSVLDSLMFTDFSFSGLNKLSP